jgi:hypothetical protein
VNGTQEYVWPRGITRPRGEASGRAPIDLLEAVAAVADGIRSDAGDHADFVSARLMTILIDSGLGPGQGQ